MGPDQWISLEHLFDELLSSDQPENLIDRVADESLRKELHRLWQAHKRASQSDFLLKPVASVHALAMSEFCFLPGQVLSRRFTIQSLLGAGGMGEVYLAFDNRLEEQVALKTVSRDLAQRPEVRRRFVSEVQNARRVTHPNVCRIFELFDDGETPFFVMEYLQGPSLAQWLQTPGRSLGVRRKIATELAEGLSAAHKNGVVHRDLKPVNVIITGTELHPRAVITDFGLARAIRENETVVSFSEQAGTLDYMAPELRSSAPASFASDYYAFGVILAELLPKDRFGLACRSPRPDQRPSSLEGGINSWRFGSTRRRLLMAGLIAGPAAAWAGYKAFSRPRVVFGSRQRVVLGGFVPQTDPLASVVRALLATGLRQSPLVNVVSDQRLGSLLEPTQSVGTQSLNRSKLLSIAQEARIAFILEGTLSRVGREIVLSLQVLDSVTDQPLLHIAESGDQDRLVRIADDASLHLRRDFGESEESLRATYKDLQQVTSSIPEALEAFYHGVHLYENADAPQSLVWFDRAIQLDPQFAIAHLYQGICLAAADDSAHAFPSYERAYQLRSRVAERERLWIESRYANITEDRLKAVNILRKLVQLYPEEAIFQRHLGFAFARIGLPLEALEHDRKAIDLDPGSVNNKNVLLCDLAQAGHFDEALDTFQKFRNEGNDSSMLELGASLAWMGKRDYVQARSCLDRMRGSPERDQEAQLPRAGVLVMQGQFHDATSILEGQLAYTEATNQSIARETCRVRLGLVHWLLDNPVQARVRAAEVAELPTSSPVYLVNLHENGVLASLCGASDIVAQTLSKLREIENKWPSTHSKGARAHIEALNKLAVHDSGAERNFQEARGLWPDPLVLFSQAVSQTASSDPNGALATFDHLETLSGDVLRNHFTGFVVLSWLWRARCLKSLSLIPDSLRYYKQVLDQWGQHAGFTQILRSTREEYMALKYLSR